MVNVDTSGYRNALIEAFGGVDSIDGLYTDDDGSARLRSRSGLRHEYRFGVINYCGYSQTSDGTHGSCGKQGLAEPHFQPYFAMTADMPLNYSQFSNAVIPPSNFRNNNMLGSFGRTAGYMLLLAFIFTGLSLILGIFKSVTTFALSTYCCFLACIFLLLGGALWTVALKRAQSINSASIAEIAAEGVGIKVSAGSGLAMVWATYGLMMVACVPYLISCCTWRGT
ncbi:hypothetical protein BKA70DRAFT_705794 [Coprinopsis sp. MPI-PUGE-AT-0042]|nr:hypothetical protein BKA70DRAFT_705794 [Coprinopsis sp. MPI-PUGE-AT-0042]